MLIFSGTSRLVEEMCEVPAHQECGLCGAAVAVSSSGALARSAVPQVGQSFPWGANLGYAGGELQREEGTWGLRGLNEDATIRAGPPLTARPWCQLAWCVWRCAAASVWGPQNTRLARSVSPFSGKNKIKTGEPPSGAL